MNNRLAWTLVIAAGAAFAADWPMWRGGADGSGVSSEPAIATHWSKTENVRWRVALPEPGNSTPVVAGGRVFITQPLQSQKQVALLCFDRETGRKLWEAKVDNASPGPTHANNYFVSSSPATDGKMVVAWFGSAGLYAYDLNGKELWHRDLGRQKHTWGYASSPMMHGGRVYLNFGPGDRSFLVALNSADGKTIWESNVPAGTGTAYQDWSPDDMYGSWSTPIVIRAAGREELVVSWPRRVVAFDPASGKQLWICEGMGDLVYPSPVFADGNIVSMAGFGQASLAVKAGGNGDVTATHRLWQTPRSKQMIGSGVISGGYLYTVDTSGIAECTEVATGKNVWTNRLHGPGDDGGVWGSAVLNDGKVYVMNKSSDVFVFRASPKFELLATNSIGGESTSSVVPSNGDLFLRTFANLWCIRGGR